MRILIYSTEFPPVVGGIATLCETLARGLVDCGADVLMLGPLCGDGEGAADAGYPFPVVRGGNHAAGGREMLRVAAQYRPDVILLPNGKAQVHASRLRSCPFPLAPYVHGTELLKHFGPHGAPPDSQRRLRRLFERADWLFTLSRSTQQLLHTMLPQVVGRTAVVTPGIDLSRIPSVSAELVEAERERWGLSDRKMVLCTARLDARKNHEGLLEAFAEVRRRRPDSVLHLAGDGPRRTELEDLAAHLRLADHVVFLGRIPADTLSAQYQLCDVFTLLSRSGPEEGFGLVLLEANVFGKPVVASRSGGIPDAVEDGRSGILVDPNDLEEIADTLVSLLSDEGRCRELGEAGRLRVHAEFRHTHMAQRMLTALRAGPQRRNRLASTTLAVGQLAGSYATAACARLWRFGSANAWRTK